MDGSPYRDPNTALQKIDASIARAYAAGATALANAARSYRASYLILAGRIDEGRAELTALRADLEGLTRRLRLAQPHSESRPRP